MVGRHVEGPHIFIDRHALGPRRHEQAGDALCIAILAARPAKGRTMGRDVHAGDPHPAAVDPPAADAVAGPAPRPGFPVGRVAALVGYGPAEGGAASPPSPAPAEFLLLLPPTRDLIPH